MLPIKLTETPLPSPQLAHVGNIELNYVVEGQGEWLVLIGGFATAYWQSWTKYLPTLSEKYRVLAFDSRGSGISSAPDLPYTTEMMANDTIGLMDRLGIQRAHILGRSLGGCVAQQIAIRHPDRVRSLAMTASFSRLGNRERVIVEHWLETIRTIGFQGFFDQLMTYFYTSEYYENSLQQIQNTIEALLSSPRSVRSFVNTGNAVLTHDTWDQLQQIAAPTLLMCGAEDVITTARHAEEMGRRIKSASVHIVPNAAHGFLTERPDSFEIIASFLASH